MWDYEDKIGDDDYNYDQEDNSESVDSETEARLYSSIYYQDSKYELIESVAGPSMVDEDNPATNHNYNNNELNKLTQFVSIAKSRPRTTTKSLPQQQPINLISSDSDVQIIEDVADTKKDLSKKWKTKKQSTVNQSSDSDDIFCENEDDLPTDISININSKSIYNTKNRWNSNPVVVTASRKRKMKKESVGGKKRLSKMAFSDPVEEMRQFYDCISSGDDEDLNLKVDDTCKANWKIDDADRFGWIADKRRFYGGGFAFKSRIRCRNCQQVGHVENRCPDPKRIPHCHLCGGENHKGDDCLYAICTRCSDIGHDASNCYVSKSELRRKCKRCGTVGHTQAHCPDVWRRCYLTTNEGAIVKGSEERNPRVYCYNCAKEGHLGHKCTKRFMNPTIRPATPFIVSYRDPKTATDADDARRKMLDESNECWKRKIERRDEETSNRKRKKRRYEPKKKVKPQAEARNDFPVRKNKNKRKAAKVKNNNLAQKNAFLETDFVRLAIDKLRRKIEKRESKKKNNNKVSETGLTLIKQQKRRKRNK